MKSDKTIARELRRLRKLIESPATNVIEARVAYEVETAIRWAREDTKCWPLPLETALHTAKMIHDELRAENSGDSSS